MSEPTSSLCPQCGAALVTGSTTAGWQWFGCPVAGGAHFSATYRATASSVTPGPVTDDEPEDMDALVSDVFAADLTVSLDSSGALQIGGQGMLSPEMLGRIERNAAQLVQHLDALPWNLGRDAEALVEREAERRARPYRDTLDWWLRATGAEGAWMDSLQRVHLPNGRTVGDGTPGSVRRAANAMLKNSDRYRAAIRLFCEALELLPAAEVPTGQTDVRRFHAVRPDVALTMVDIARQWDADGTLDRLPARLPVGELAEWNAPAHAIRSALALLDRGGNEKDTEAARDGLFEIVPDVKAWLSANQSEERNAA